MKKNNTQSVYKFLQLFKVTLFLTFHKVDTLLELKEVRFCLLEALKDFTYPTEDIYYYIKEQ